MSKSIFIIDTPTCCGECPMSGTSVCRKWSMKEARTFPKDCPLKPAYDVDRVSNDPVVISAKCAPTAYDVDKVVERLESQKSGLTTWAEDEAYKMGLKKQSRS